MKRSNPNGSFTFLRPKTRFLNTKSESSAALPINRAIAAAPSFDFSKLNKVRHALPIFAHLLKIKSFPNAIPFTRLLNAILRLEDYSLAFRMFNTVRHLTLPLDTTLLNVAINCCSLANRSDLGFAVLSIFVKSGLVPNTSTFNTLIRSLCLDNKLADSQNLFDRLWKERICEPDAFTYTIMVDGYGKVGRVGCCHAYLGHMIIRGVSPNRVTYETLLDVYCLLGKMEQARKIFDYHVRNFGRNITVYCTLMKGYCKVGDVEKALSVYSEIPRVGLVHTKVSSTAILDGLFHAGRCEEALKIFCEMQEKDVIAYTAVINGLCKSRKNQDQSSELRNKKNSREDYEKEQDKTREIQMESQSKRVSCFLNPKRFLNPKSELSPLPMVINRGIAAPHSFDFRKLNKVSHALAFFAHLLKIKPFPNAIPFTQLLNAILKLDDYSLALRMFNTARRLPLPLDTILLNVAINCCSLANRSDLGFTVLSIFVKSGLVPNTWTFNTLIRGMCLDNKLADAQNLFDRLWKEKICEPDAFTYTIMIDAYGKVGRVECSHAYLGHMMRREVIPNNVTYGALLDGYCLLGKMELARKIFDYHVMNFGRNFMVYCTLMKGYCKVRDVEQALSVYSKIPRVGLVHTKVSCTTILDGLFHAGRCEEALKIFSEMEEQDVVAYTAVIDGLCKNKKIKEAFSVLGMMEDSGVTPNIKTYTTLIQGVFGEGQVDTAMSLFYSLPSKGLQPNTWTHNMIIAGYCKLGYMDKAKLHFMEMENFGCPPNKYTYEIFIKAYLELNEQV